MAALKMEWVPTSKSQFEVIKQRAEENNQLVELLNLHQRIVNSLTDLQKALELGELLYNTRKPGGQVRHWIYQGISVCYALLPEEGLGWILQYHSIGKLWSN